jgi:hypothetical protein
MVKKALVPPQTQSLRGVLQRYIEAHSMYMAYNTNLYAESEWEEGYCGWWWWWKKKDSLSRENIANMNMTS